MHKSLKTNASQIFSWKEQKSVFFRQTNQFYLVGTFGDILYLEFVTAFEYISKNKEELFKTTNINFKTTGGELICF